MPEEQNGAVVRIWDIWIRTFHWAFACSILFLLISGETGFQFFEWHRRIGEFVLFLLLFRLIWGIFGSKNARFVSFIKHPRLAVTHLLALFKTGDVPQEQGHNAAGGWAVLIMLLLVSFQAISGLLIADEDELIEGAFYGLLSSSQSDRLLHLHHTNAKLNGAIKNKRKPTSA